MRLRLILVLFALTMLWPAIGRATEEKRLHVYNWSDYIAPDTIANFDARYRHRGHL